LEVVVLEKGFGVPGNVCAADVRSFAGGVQVLPTIASVVVANVAELSWPPALTVAAGVSVSAGVRGVN